MASIKNTSIVILLGLLALLVVVSSQRSQGGPHTSQGGAHVSQGGPHENQSRVRRQVLQDGQENQNQQNEDPVRNYVVGASDTNWTTCDWTTTPRISCEDCHTLLICKPIGGILKPCREPYRPYCSNGYCSPVPSADCTQVIDTVKN